MALTVTALSPNDDLTALKAALNGAGLSLDALQVIAPQDASVGASRGIVGGDLLTTDSGTGTGVPGINNVHQPAPYFRNESLADRLSDFEIPDSQLDNYVEALERGRFVIAYFAHAETIDAVEALFRDANLLNVRRF